MNPLTTLETSYSSIFSSRGKTSTCGIDRVTVAWHTLGRPYIKLNARARKTLYYVIDIDYIIPCHAPNAKFNSPIFNLTRFPTESPNFLHANISAFMVVPRKAICTKMNVHAILITFFSLYL